MMGDLERIVFFVPGLYLAFYLIAWKVTRKWFP
jgi:hypothetical protein